MATRIIGVLIILSCVLVTAGDSYAGKKQTFEQLCLEALETVQSFYPVRSTEMGIHAYDNRLTDYSSKSVKSMIKRLTGIEKKLYKFKPSKLNSYQQLNKKLTKATVDVALLDLKAIKWHKKSPQLYIQEAVDGVYFLLLSNHDPLSERVVPIIGRMKAVPAHLATARKNIKNPPRVFIEAAMETTETAMEFFQQVSGELMNKFPERADQILKVSTAAREAMNDYSSWLSDVIPGPETAFAIGKDNFDYKLGHEYFLQFDSDSLLVLGEQLLNESQTAYREYEQYVETHHQNGQDSVFVPATFARDDILEYYNWETAQVRTFLELNDLMSIPDDIAPVTVIETPSFLRTMISGIAYQPAAPFDSIQHGYFYVRPIPEDLSRRQLEARFRYTHRRGFKGSVVHEAYPGHHLQMQLAGRHVDPVRKWQYNMMLIEGWALYCEEMVYHAGLYGEEDPSRWLGTLGGIQFRAARIVVDVKLHTGQFTYDEAVAWMTTELNVTTDSGREYIAKEVRRYCHAPTIQMAYLMGKQEIMNLRRAVEKKEGDTFSLKSFHDRLLAEGSIPPSLLWDIFDVERKEKVL
ncbi:MAG: DUF885 domain-containing protein [candidate division Zixibacteria bacterium]|nr:DUF885 domain-containing protein [candidate division Zixibacteria bacterium]